MNKPTKALARLGVLLLLVFGFTSMANAQTVFTAPGAPATGTGADASNPVQLQEAIFDVNNGTADAISFAGGRYRGGIDVFRSFDITAPTVDFLATNTNGATVTLEGVTLLQIGEVMPDEDDPFDDTATEITLEEGLRFVLSGVNEVRFAFTNGPATEDQDGDGDVDSDDDAQDPTGDTPSKIIGDGTLVINTNSVTRLAVDSSPGRAVIENLEIHEDANGVVRFVDRQLEQFIGSTPASLHITNQLDVLGGALDIDVQDLLVTLDVDNDGTPRPSFTVDTEIMGSGALFFVLVDSDNEATRNPFSTSGTGEVNIDFYFPYSQAEDTSGDDEYDVTITWSSFGQDLSVIGGTVTAALEDALEDELGVDIDDDGEDDNDDGQETDPKVRFTNATNVNGDLEIDGVTPNLNTVPASIFSVLEDLDDDGTAVAFDREFTVTDNLRVKGGALTVRGDNSNNSYNTDPAGASSVQGDLVAEDGVVRIQGDGFSVEGDFVDEDEFGSTDDGDAAFFMLDGGDLFLAGDLDFSTSPIFSYNETGAPSNPSEEPIEPVEDCDVANSDVINANIGSAGLNVDEAIRFVGDDDQEIFLRDTDLIARRVVIIKMGDDVEINDDSDGNLVIAATQVGFDAIGVEAMDNDVFVSAVDPDASSFLYIANAEFTTNGRLDANGTAQVTINWTNAGRGVLDAGDADRAYVGDARTDTPFKIRYEGNVGIFTGDELPGNSTGRTVGVDLDGDGADEDVVRVNIVQVAIDDADLDNAANTPVLTIGKDIAITCNLDLFESDLDPGSAQVFLANDLLISVRDGSVRRLGTPPFQGEIVFPTAAAPGGFGVDDLILGSDFDPSLDGIDLLYYSTADRTVGLEFPEADRDEDVIRDLTVDVCLRDACNANQNGPTIYLRRTTGDIDFDDENPSGDDIDRFRVNQDVLVQSGVLDIVGNTLEINAVNGVDTQVFVDTDGDLTDFAFYAGGGAAKMSTDDMVELGTLTSALKVQQEAGDDVAVAETLERIRAIRPGVDAAKAQNHGDIGLLRFIGNQQTDVEVDTRESRLSFNFPAIEIDRAGTAASHENRVTFNAWPPCGNGVEASASKTADHTFCGNVLTVVGGNTVVQLDRFGTPYFAIVNASSGSSTTANNGGAGVVVYAGLDVFDIFGNYEQSTGEFALSQGTQDLDGRGARAGVTDNTPDGGFWFQQMFVGSQTFATDFPGMHLQTDGEFYGQGADETVFGDFQLGLTDGPSTAIWNGFPYTLHTQHGNFYVGVDQNPGPGFYLGSPCVVPGVENCGSAGPENQLSRRNQYAQGGFFNTFTDRSGVTSTASGTLVMLGDDYQFLGTGDSFADAFVAGIRQGLDGLVIFGQDGPVPNGQTVFHRQDEDAMFNKVSIQGDPGIEIQDQMWVNYTGTVDLQLGDIRSPEGSPEFELKNLNPIFEGPFIGRNSAPTNLMGPGFSDGARDSYVGRDTPIRRLVTEGQSSGGDVFDGYYFPHGTRRAGNEAFPNGREFFQPLILEFTNDLGDGQFAKSTLLSEFDTSDFEPFRTDAAGAGANQVVEDGLLVNVVSPIFYQVEFFGPGSNESLFEAAERDVPGETGDPANRDIPSEDPNIRIIADGLAGAVNIKRVRILHFSCEGEFLGLAGIYDLLADGIDDGSFNNNDFINGIPNLIQEGVNVRQCNVFAIGANAFENPVDGELGSGSFNEGTARAQLIHEASGAGAVDIFINGVQATTLEYDAEGNKATPFLTLPSGDVTITVTEAGGGTDVLTTTVNLTENENHVVFVTDDGVFKIEDARVVNNDNDVDVVFAHTASDAPDEVDIRTLDPFNDNISNRILANNLEYLEASGYVSLAAATHSIEVTTADNSAQAGVFFFDFNGLGGQTLTCFASNAVGSGKVTQGGVTVLCADISGNIIDPDVITDTEDAAEVPTEFSLLGNYPNPFNPSTTISFDLPETAEVTLEVVDMLGRRVMSETKQVQAGAERTFEVNASNLASGVYIYRLVVDTTNGKTMSQTGRMTLVK